MQDFLAVSCDQALRIADALAKDAQPRPSDEAIRQACIELARAYREVTLGLGRDVCPGDNPAE